MSWRIGADRSRCKSALNSWIFGALAESGGCSARFCGRQGTPALPSSWPSRRRGNDLSTPLPDFGFPGLKPGDRWCLCAARWQEALEANAAPRVVLSATHEKTLEVVELADLKRYALDLA